MYLVRVPDGWIITAAIAITTTGCLIISFLCSSLWFYIAGGCCLFLATLVSHFHLFVRTVNFEDF